MLPFAAGLKVRRVGERSVAETTQALSRMRHDLRSPLAVIIGLAQVLREDLTDAEHKQDLEFIVSNGQQLQTLIDEFVEIVRELTNGALDGPE